MTFADIRARTLERVEADPADLAWQSSAAWAINEGQRLFAFLALPLEGTLNLQLVPGVTFYHMLPLVWDWILPLRVDRAGMKIRSATVWQMAAADSAWLNTSGPATRYGHLGWDMFFVDRRPPGYDVLTITYARSPVWLVNDNDVPEIHEADHEDLVNYGVARLRLNEGGQELNEATKLMQSFLGAAKRRADQVRLRSLAQGYDRVPVELVPELRQQV